MAPSATTESVGDVIVPVTKGAEKKEEIEHVHGGEGKTPLEAISHGSLVHPGKSDFLFASIMAMGICFKSSDGGYNEESFSIFWGCSLTCLCFDLRF